MFHDSLELEHPTNLGLNRGWRETERERDEGDRKICRSTESKHVNLGKVKGEDVGWGEHTLRAGDGIIKTDVIILTDLEKESGGKDESKEK